MIAVLFEDEDYLAVDKPEGLAAIPERSPGSPSLLAELQAAFPGRLYVVHRLDKPVSGVLVFARNAAAHRHLNDQFSAREVHKTYVALAHGDLRDDSGAIEHPLRAFGSGRMGVDAQRGKACVTEYDVLERYGAYTLVRVRPVTGRRHQIRVHLYSLGHPIVGDALYGDRAVQRSYARLMLHARTLAFRHVAGTSVRIQAPPAPSFHRVMEALSLRAPGEGFAN